MIFKKLLEKEFGVKVEVEYRFHSKRRFRFDYAILEHKIAIEQEGGIYTRGAHGSVSGILRDIEKYNLATVCGWRILRVQPENLLSNHTFDMIQKLINYDTTSNC